MTFSDKYKSEETWQGRVLIMNIYHNAMSQRDKSWTLTDTANYFECSIGLVSENLKLASNIDKVTKCTSRKEALRKL